MINHLHSFRGEQVTILRFSSIKQHISGLFRHSCEIFECTVISTCSQLAFLPFSLAASTHHTPHHSWDFSPSKGHARNEVVTFCREPLLSVLFSSTMRESIIRSGVQQDRRAKWVSDDRKWKCALFVGSTVESISSNSLFFPPRREQGQSCKCPFEWCRGTWVSHTSVWLLSRRQWWVWNTENDKTHFFLKKQ